MEFIIREKRLEAATKETYTYGDYHGVGFGFWFRMIPKRIGITEPLTLKMLADVACYSPWHAERIFKELTGKSPFA